MNHHKSIYQESKNKRQELESRVRALFDTWSHNLPHSADLGEKWEIVRCRVYRKEGNMVREGKDILEFLSDLPSIQHTLDREYIRLSEEENLLADQYMAAVTILQDN